MTEQSIYFNSVCDLVAMPKPFVEFKKCQLSFPKRTLITPGFLKKQTKKQKQKKRQHSTWGPVKVLGHPGHLERKKRLKQSIWTIGFSRWRWTFYIDFEPQKPNFTCNSKNHLSTQSIHCCINDFMGWYLTHKKNKINNQRDLFLRDYFNIKITAA